MKVLYANEFRKQFKSLPVRIQLMYHRQESLLVINPFDARLHVKPLQGYDGVFSFRITRRYRVLFRIDQNTIIICLSIGHRKDAYR
jgi:mRNA-degrading endonuclease RelE of RelBE toxin-antitoxin system